MIEVIMWLIIGALLITIIYLADYYTTDEMRQEYREQQQRQYATRKAGSISDLFRF